MGLLGLSMGQIMAGMWLWLENITPISRIMGVIMTFAGMSGKVLSPFIVGQLITQFPDVFLVQNLAISIIHLLLISIGIYIGQRQAEEKQKQTESELTKMLN